MEAYSLNDQLFFVKDNNLRGTVIQYITGKLHMTNIPHMHVLSNMKTLYEAALSDKRLNKWRKEKVTDSRKYINLYSKLIADAKESLIYQLDTHYLPKDDRKVEASFQRHAAELDRAAAMSRAEAENTAAAAAELDRAAAMSRAEAENTAAAAAELDRAARAEAENMAEVAAAPNMRELKRCMRAMHFDLDNDVNKNITKYFKVIDFHLNKMNHYRPISTDYREVCFIMFYMLLIQKLEI
jgi:hypothetical protein